jgi:glycerol-3-phosphate cytidylyltransferase
MKKQRIVVTFGTFDLFHVGHLRMLLRAKTFGDKLVVGVSSDQLNFQKKNRYPEFNQDERLEIVNKIKGVDSVFLEESLELKLEYLRQHSADVMVIGDDWKGQFDNCKAVCDVIYLPRTPSISTTAIIEKVRS